MWHALMIVFLLSSNGSSGLRSGGYVHHPAVFYHFKNIIDCQAAADSMLQSREVLDASCVDLEELSR
jgi:hypothetical protein